jgi:hypothetical protein
VEINPLLVDRSRILHTSVSLSIVGSWRERCRFIEVVINDNDQPTLLAFRLAYSIVNSLGNERGTNAGDKEDADEDASQRVPDRLSLPLK